MRRLRDEPRREETARLSDANGRPEERDESDNTAAAYAGAEGSHPRPFRAVRAVRADRALAAKRPAAARSGAPPVAGRARQARRLVGVHPVLLLLDLLPELLVEPGQVPRSLNPVAVLSLACRQPRSAHWR